MANLEQTQSILEMPAASRKTSDVWPTVLRVAWLSIGLGLALEILLLVLAAYTDTAGTTPKPFLSDLAQKISWFFIVCVGLAFGSVAATGREKAMGLLGLISPRRRPRSTWRPRGSTKFCSRSAAPSSSTPRERWRSDCKLL